MIKRIDIVALTLPCCWLACVPFASAQEFANTDILGTWTTSRPSTWQFKYDGTLIYTAANNTSRGRWKRDGDKVYVGAFTKEKSFETQQWFSILSLNDNKLRIEMHGKEVREDTWDRADEIVIGSWRTARPSTWRFQPDGNLTYTQNGRTSKGKWKRDGKRILIGDRDATGSFNTRQWFTIKNRRGTQLEIEMHGKQVRNDEWELVFSDSRDLTFR